jgi:hypothetical protein
MTNDRQSEPPHRVTRRVPVATLLWALVPSLVATAIVVFFVARA